MSTPSPLSTRDPPSTVMWRPEISSVLDSSTLPASTLPSTVPSILIVPSVSQLPTTFMPGPMIEITDSGDPLLPLRSRAILTSTPTEYWEANVAPRAGNATESL